jgi:hypothetical protein
VRCSCGLRSESGLDCVNRRASIGTFIDGPNCLCSAPCDPHFCFGSQKTSYKLPNITAVSGTVALLTNGGQPITLTGTDFGAVASGATISVGYGNGVYIYTAVSCAVTVSHTAAECNSVAGIGAGFSLASVVAHHLLS